MSELTQREYLARYMAAKDEKSSLRTARAKGLAEGEAKGRADGIAEGKADDARKMLADGLDISKIAQYTGLSLEQIQALSH